MCHRHRDCENANALQGALKRRKVRLEAKPMSLDGVEVGVWSGRNIGSKPLQSMLLDLCQEALSRTKMRRLPRSFGVISTIFASQKASTLVPKKP